MRILVLSGIAPNEPHDGDKLRLHHHLRQLRKRGYRVDLFCLSREEAPPASDPSWRALAHRVHVEKLANGELALNLAGGTLAGWSWNVSAYFSVRFKRAVEAHAASPEGAATDAVLAHRLRMVPYAEAFLKERRKAHPGAKPAPYLVDFTDCMTGYARQASAQGGIPWLTRAVAYWDTPLLEEEEKHAARDSGACLAVSEGEREALIALGAPPDKVYALPNGVEFPAKVKTPRPTEYPAGSPVAAFVGNLGYPPNHDAVHWFLDNVWPDVKKQAPGAVFCAVGGYPRGALRQRDNGADIRVLPFVPDLSPYLAHAAVTVAPLRVASGFQNKVALSLAHGVPVVATPQALKWMPKEAKGGVKEAAGTWDFACQTAGLLLRPGRARQAALKAGRTLARMYNWDKSGKALDAIIRKVVKERRRR